MVSSKPYLSVDAIIRVSNIGSLVNILWLFL